MYIQKDRHRFHPDLLIEKCVDTIGDEKKHPPVLRNHTRWGVGLRMNSWETFNWTMFALRDAADFHMGDSGGVMITGKGNLLTPTISLISLHQ
jgi:hypothetical protein